MLSIAKGYELDTDPAELWAPVVGFEGYFEVSDRGRVRSVTRSFRRANGAVVRWTGKVLAVKTNRGGYCYVVFKVAGVQYRRAVHHLVLEAFVGRRPYGQLGRHLNDQPSDNRPANLAWGSQSANMRDSVDRGRHRETKKQRCKRGHPLTGRNLRASRLAKGQRQCVACARALNTVSHAHGPRHLAPDTARWDSLVQAESDRRFARLGSGGQLC